jgi:predicted ArsR family transcriptional regulator
MTKALSEGKSSQAIERLNTAAREEGQRLGTEARSNGSSASPSRSLKLAMVVLRDNGFEPQVEGSNVVLRNCPFEALARESKELVCGMNLALVEGVVDGLGNPDVRAKLAPAPGRCCVTLLSEDRRESK